MKNEFTELRHKKEAEEALRSLWAKSKDVVEATPREEDTIEAVRYTASIDRGLKALRWRVEGMAPHSVSYPETEESMQLFVKLFGEIGSIYLRATENRDFEVDDNNLGLVRLMIAYQLKWEDAFVESYRGCLGTKPVSLYAPLLLIGERGVGKTLLLSVASEFARITGNNGRSFLSTSASELLNYYRVKNNIDRYTYNTEGTKAYVHTPPTAKPLNVCFNDLGIENDDKTNVFGTSLTTIVKDFLLARYEIYQNTGALCHATTNLGIPALRKLYPERITDRFSQYNVILMRGESRRKR